jgi:hypothetical protein
MGTGSRASCCDCAVSIPPSLPFLALKKTRAVCYQALSPIDNGSESWDGLVTRREADKHQKIHVFISLFCKFWIHGRLRASILE